MTDPFDAKHKDKWHSLPNKTFTGESDWLPWSSSTPAASQDDCTIEWSYLQGKITDLRITKGAVRYGRFKRFRNWLHRRAPWLPSWVTGWVVVRYRRPTKPFPHA